jgi:thymidylate synthase (FAD)
MDNQEYIRAPHVYLVGRPTVDEKALSKFLSDEHTSWRRSSGAAAAEELVELGGRVCYMSFGKMQSPRDVKAYIRNLVEMGHDSVLEHATWTFIITGVSRAFSHQLVRHRAGFSFSQLSQQYHDETNARFVIPEGLHDHPEVEQAWGEFVDSARHIYSKLLKQLDMNIDGREQRRALRSAARSLLPNATETKVAVTANARAIRHFLVVRGGIVGDVEMRRVCALLLELMKVEAPSIFGDFETTSLADGSPSVELVGGSS